MSTCPLTPMEKQPSANFIRDAHIMLSPFVKTLEHHEAQIQNIFSGMPETQANLGVQNICQNDPLIREFARSILNRLGEEHEQRLKDIYNIRTKVRTLGRLLKELNTTENCHISSLDSSSIVS